MKILAIESASETASAALYANGKITGEFSISNKLTHSEKLLSLISLLLKMTDTKKNELDAIAVSKGPGSYTGLRIGAGLAKGMGLALSIPLISVPTLLAFSGNVSCAENICSCPLLDARNKRIYGACYRKRVEIISAGPYEISSFIDLINDTLNENETAVFSGDGSNVNREYIEKNISVKYIFVSQQNNFPRAASVAETGADFYGVWLQNNKLNADEIRGHVYEYDCFDSYVTNPDMMVPDYLNRTQAERELGSGILEDAGKHSLKKML